MQVKEININTGKIKGYEICKKKKEVKNLIFRWSYHSDLLYSFFNDFQFTLKLPKRQSWILFQFTSSSGQGHQNLH